MLTVQQEMEPQKKLALAQDLASEHAVSGTVGSHARQSRSRLTHWAMKDKSVESILGEGPEHEPDDPPPSKLLGRQGLDTDWCLVSKGAVQIVGIVL